MEKKKSKVSKAKKNFNNNIKKNVEVEEVKETKEVQVVKEEVKTTKQDHTLFKIIAIIVIVVALLTWLVKSGSWSYNANEAGQTIAEFTENEKTTTTGINELFLSSYYAVNYYLIQLVFLAILGLFYGVVSKTKGYKAMVKKFAKLFKSKETIFALVVSFIIALFTSFTTQPIVILTFIPLVYSVAKELKINKISTLLITFGALAVGLMGVTYGTYGVYYAASNMSVKVTEGIAYRAAILVAGYLLLNMFVVLFNKKNKNLEVANDQFEIVEDEKGAHAWPYFVIFGVLFVFMVLGYISYANSFGIDVFTKFHTWLSTELVFGEDKTPVIYNILGNITEFGSWDPFVLAYIMIIAMIVIKFVSETKWDDVFENAIDGLKVMARPILIAAFAYSIFVLCYWSGLVNPIINFFNSGEGFNPYFNTIGNVIADFLHIDVEYTGFSYAALYASKFADNLGQVLACMTSASGLMALVAPTSIFMITGLTLSNISYKEYLKSTWKLVAALVVVICLILTVVTYL